MTLGGAIRLAALLLVVLSGFDLAARSGPAETRDDLVVSGVTIVNPGEKRVARAEIRVTEGRIRAITAMRPSRSAPRRFALPGLIDMHVHVWSERAALSGLLFLSHGVTSVRDVGDSEGRIFATRASFERGTPIGPRVFACGPFLDGEPAVWPGSRIPESAAEAEAIVEELADRGASCIKIYRHLPPDRVHAAARAARRRGLTVVGHVPDGMNLESADLDDVQHLTGVVDDSADHDLPVAERAERGIRRWDALESRHLEETADLSRRLGIAHTPTLVFWQRFFRLLTPDDPPRELERVIPEEHREEHWNPTKPWSRTAEDRRAARRALRRMQRAVAIFHRRGVRLSIGSDALNPYNLPGESLHDELRLFVGAGLTPEETLRIATRGAAEALGRDDLGILREGAVADFLVFREDPTHDLDALSTLETVVIRGQAYSKSELDRGLEAIERREDAIPDAVRVWSRMLQGLGVRDRRL